MISQQAKPEFQVVILAAGRGNQLLELTGGAIASTGTSVGSEPLETIQEKTSNPISASGSRSAQENLHFAKFKNGMPKALLPIGNRPMIWYTLTSFKNVGFSEATIIVLDTQRDVIRQALSSDQSLADMDLTFISVPAAEEYGTADCVRRIRDRLSAPDVILCGCDLILSSATDLLTILNTHRIHSPTLTVTILNNNSPADNSLTVPGGKEVLSRSSRDFVGFDDKADLGRQVQSNNNISSHRLVYLANEESLENEINPGMPLLERCKALTIHSHFQDAFLYIAKRWILTEFLEQDRNIFSVRTELIPKLIRYQFRIFKVPRKGAATTDFDGNAESQNSSQTGDDLELQDHHESASSKRESFSERRRLNSGSGSLSGSRGTVTRPGVRYMSDAIKNHFEDELADELAGLEMLDSGDNVSAGPPPPPASPQVYPNSAILCMAAVINQSPENFSLRTNSFPAYVYANQNICKILSAMNVSPPPSIQSMPQLTDPSTGQLIKAFYDSDSIISQDLVRGGMFSAKKSNVGLGVSLDGGIRLEGSTLLGYNCHLEEQVKLINCLVGSGVKIGKRCELQDCIIPSGAVVPAGTKSKATIVS